MTDDDDDDAKKQSTELTGLGNTLLRRFRLLGREVKVGVIQEPPLLTCSAPRCGLGSGLPPSAVLGFVMTNSMI